MNRGLTCATCWSGFPATRTAASKSCCHTAGKSLRPDRPLTSSSRRIHVTGDDKPLTFVQACQAAGLKTLLVSGGFTFFSERIRARLALDFARANMLEIVDGQLTGRLVPRPWGEIVDGAEKRRVLLEVAELMGIAPEQAIAVGDGANDLPMMGVAGLSIAYHPKPAVLQQAMLSITQGGMDRALSLLQA